MPWRQIQVKTVDLFWRKVLSNKTKKYVRMGNRGGLHVGPNSRGFGQ